MTNGDQEDRELISLIKCGFPANFVTFLFHHEQKFKHTVSSKRENSQKKKKKKLKEWIMGKGMQGGSNTCLSNLSQRLKLDWLANTL